MNQDNITFHYGIGASSQTKSFQFQDNDYLKPLEHQFLKSLPIITSFRLQTLNAMEIPQNLFSIYVGKEICLQTNIFYYQEKYDLNPNEIKKFRTLGYERICVLNYKKYDQVMVGLKESDKVVTDYYALKRYVLKLAKLFSC